MTLQLRSTPVLRRLFFYRSEEDVEFSFWWFAAFSIIQTALFLTLTGLIYQFTHRDYVRVQLHSRWYSYLACFAIIRFALSLVEYLFHRYVLHLVVLKPLETFKVKHTNHHNLTNPLLDTYPITESEQIQSSTFPYYTLAIFWVVFSIAFFATQWLLPGLPILLSGYLAVVSAFVEYEVIHARYHFNYEKHWKTLVEKSERAKRDFAFHLMHHIYKFMNMAIAATFWGLLPFWDIIFGTYYVPKVVPLPGEVEDWRPTEPLPRPRWPISVLDKWFFGIHRRRQDKLRRRRQIAT